MDFFSTIYILNFRKERNEIFEGKNINSIMYFYTTFFGNLRLFF